MKKKLTIAFQISRTADAFNQTCVQHLHQQHPDHSILLVSDGKEANSAIPQLPHDFIKPAISNALLRKYWYSIQLPKWLHKNHCDFFFSSDFSTPDSEHTKTILSLRAPLQYDDKKLQKHLKAAFRVMVHNSLLAEELRISFPEYADKLVELPIGMTAASATIDDETKINVLQQVTEGQDFFLYITAKSTTEELLMMLRSFSIFKKWQRSEMKLVIVTQDSPNKTFLSKLEHYKFRHDVILLSQKEMTREIISAAYACVMPNTLPMNMHALIMSAGIPLIMPTDKYLIADYGESVIFSEWNEQELSKKMILLYKDESYRSEQIQAGFQLLQLRNWEMVASKIWDMVLLPALA